MTQPPAAPQRRSRRQGVHDDARQGPRGARRVRPAAPDHDLVGGGRRSPTCRAPPRAACCARSPQLGYVEQDGRTFSLSPRILDLGFAYLSTQSWIDRALPLMRELERASRRILLGRDPARHRHRLCRARADPPHHVGGARRSAAGCRRFHTALGRDQLGYLDEAEIWRRLMSQRIEPYTPQTITDLQALFDRITRRPRAGLFHRRRGARARPALDRRAGGRSQRPGGRRHQPVDALDANHAQRNARAVSARSSIASPSRSRR